MSNLVRWLTRIVYSPILWGAAAAVGFYAPIHLGAWQHPMVVRYFAGHWVEYVTTGLFFVGLAALALKAWALAAQRELLGLPLIDAPPAAGQSVSQCPVLLARLARQPRRFQDSYLVRRLREAIEYVERRGTAESLDDELHYLSDIDAGRMHASYALVRIIIWAVPILGFLGTVIGITEAVASLSPQALENSLPTVTAGLGVAFDTTALSLGLSMVLMFSQFLCERFESSLLDAVDARVNHEMVGRFEVAPGGADPQVATVRRMAETVVQACDKLVARQTELWQQALSATFDQWTAVLEGSGRRLEEGLHSALGNSLREFAQGLQAAQQAATEQNGRQWTGVQQSLEACAAAAAAQQQELSRQAEVLLKVVDATALIAQLEQTLNRNLGAVAAAQGFQETAASLAATIPLLAARLGQPLEAPKVELKSSRRGHAA